MCEFRNPLGEGLRQTDQAMTADEVLNEFRAAGAFLEGHFILTSGLESPLFIQKVFVFQDP